jgi:1-acyl-sn-glycerol-3-phosphate acyltransferase
MPTVTERPAVPPGVAGDIDDRTLGVVADLAREVHAGTGTGARIGLDSKLERDIGFDSLERAELLLRLERAFGVRLPPRTLATAETPRDLVRAIEAGTPLAPGAPPAIATPLAEPVAAVPGDALTLLDVLDWHADRRPRRTHLTLLVETDAGPREVPLAYGELRDEATRVAAGLAARGVEPGDAIAIMLPTSREFFAAFFGILVAGGVPVPIYPPARRSQLEEHLRRQAGILGNCEATLLITVAEAGGFARVLRASTPSLRHIATVAELAAPAGPAPTCRPGPRDVAFLQYTSGSTGNPKGVVLTHANLLANIRAMGPAIGVTPEDVFVSWLPLYHDMGLIGAWFGTLYYGVPFVVMSPTDFLGRPESWLRAIHRYRATLSAGPNFAYEMCSTRLDAARLAGLDLSSWRIAFNGAEAVSAATLDRFAARFAACGFRAQALTPVYGLAECAVGLTFPPPGRGPLVDAVDRTRLARDGVAVPAGAQDRHPLRVVCCGRPLAGHDVRVIDPAGHELPERREGRIEFRGPSATSGYFRNPEATRKLFDGDWLDTGDLGYFAAGELYLTGRAKDLIIRGGQHIHPQEAETAVGAIAGVRKGCVTVFGVPDRGTGTERVIVMAETRETDPGRVEQLRRAIADQMATLHGAPPDDIVLAPPHTVLKTSSGKLRRAACRELYERGMTGAGPRALWRQTLQLAWAGLAGTARRGAARVADFAFGLYAWFLLVPLALAALLLTAALPTLRLRRRAARGLARAFLAASGLPVRVTGAEHFPRAGPLIVVANHASYLDGIVLTAILPARCRFVAKRELEANAATRLLLRGIGTQFVERFDVEGSVDAGRELAALAATGESLAFFPEGTFRREPGLLPFHMGAFVAAAATGTPIVPVALRGMRSVLRDGQWLPRRVIVQVAVNPPVAPDGRDWSAAVRLRDRAREAILAGCGEADRPR